MRQGNPEHFGCKLLPEKSQIRKDYSYRATLSHQIRLKGCDIRCDTRGTQVNNTINICLGVFPIFIKKGPKSLTGKIANLVFRLEARGWSFITLCCR
jgi:hypothetical protein